MEPVRQPLRRLSAILLQSLRTQVAVAALLIAAFVTTPVAPAAAAPSAAGPGDIAHTIYRPKVGDTYWTSGSTGDLDRHRAPYKTALPPGKGPGNVIAVAIAPNDRVYAWYDDGTVSSGTTKDLDAHRKPYRFSSPAFDPYDITGIAIAKNSRVYTWYDNGKVSVGTTSDLDRYKAPYPYSLPPGYSIHDVVDMAIAKSSDHVYVWYRNGRVSSGKSWDLDAYRAPYGYTTHPKYVSSAHYVLVGLGIASSDHVYAMHARVTPVP